MTFISSKDQEQLEEAILAVLRATPGVDYNQANQTKDEIMEEVKHHLSDVVFTDWLDYFMGR